MWTHAENPHRVVSNENSSSKVKGSSLEGLRRADGGEYPGCVLFGVPVVGGLRAPMILRDNISTAC